MPSQKAVLISMPALLLLMSAVKLVARLTESCPTTSSEGIEVGGTINLGG